MKKNTVKVNKVEKDKALQMRLRGETYQAISEKFNVTPGAIHKALKGLVPTRETELFKASRGDVIAEMQRQLLTSIGTKDIGRMSPAQRVLAFAQCYDKERLERQLSSVNVMSIRADIAALKGLQQRNIIPSNNNQAGDNAGEINE